MVKLKNIVCSALLIIASCFCVVACKEKPNPNVKVDFATLKDIVECSSDLANWSGVNATTISSANVNSSFKSNKQVVDGNVKADYLHIKGDNITYCDDNVEYFVDNNRKYMNEDFDYIQVMDNVLYECMPSVIEFFANKNNYKKLISSDKITEGENIIYTFAMWINKDNNQYLEGKFTYNADGILIAIDIEIKSNDNKDFVSSIVPNEEIINTPEWFDSNDYKRQMTYEEVKAVVLDENLFDGWKNAHIFLPEIVGNEQEMYMSQPTTNDSYNYYSIIKKYSGNSDGKVYYTGGKEYIYIDNSPYSIKENDIESRSLKSDLEDYSAMCFQQFFFDNNENESYYVNAKKLEKDRVVISFKFEHEYANQLLIGSLFYNLDNELYYIDVYFGMDEDGERKEMHFTFEKLLESIQIPDWFNVDDFGESVPASQIEEIFTHEGISSWGGSYIYNASVNMMGSSYISDGIHFKESASIYNANGNITYYSKSYASEEANKEITESVWEESGRVIAEAGTYTFWVNKKFENKECYVANNIKYDYKNNTKSQTSYELYNCDFYDSFLKSIISQFLNGAYIAQFELPGKVLTNMITGYNNNIPLPGDRIIASHATKSTINDMDVYTLKYITNNKKTSFLDYTIAIDKDGKLQKIELVSNFLLPVQGVATFTLQRNTSPITPPEWV